MASTLFTGLHQVYTALGHGAQTGDPNVQSIDNGAILVTDDTLTAIGDATSLRRDCPPGTREIDMGGRTAVPAFIDPHTHLVWGGERSDEFNRRLHGDTYVEIAAEGGGIKKTVAQTRAASRDDLRRKATRTLNHMLQHGVATIEAKSGYGLDLATESKQLDVMDALAGRHAVEIHQTFMGAHEIPPAFAGRAGEYVDYLNDECLPVVKARGNVRFVDIFCEKGVFELADSRRHMTRAAELGFTLRFHADELYPLGGAGLAAELGAISADHVVHATEADMARMANAGTMATLLPGTSFFLRGPYANAKAFGNAGCAIALSTDFNPGSSHTVSQALMMALACMNMGMTFEQAFCGITLNAAAALDIADRTGTLEVGKQADIVFLDAPSALHLVYYWGVNLVTDVVKAGHFAVRDGKVL